MAIDYEAIAAAGGIGKRNPQVLSRDQRKAEKEKALRTTYAAVDARDGMVSWVSGARLIKGAENDKKRVERHHMDRRSTHPERIADPHNIITASAYEAEYLDTHRLIPVDANGDECHDTRRLVDFRWDRNRYAPGQEPFTVKTTIPQGASCSSTSGQDSPATSRRSSAPVSSSRRRAAKARPG